MSMKTKLAATLVAILTINSANAIIIDGAVTSGSGSFVKLTPRFTVSSPNNTVGKNTFNTPNLYGFDEAQNVKVNSSGILPEIGSFLDPGIMIASHYIFYDPKGNSSQSGYIRFDASILGVLTSTDSLAASDYLAQTGVNYLNPKLRGLEKRDSVSIDPLDTKKLNVNWRASSPGDYIRVLTEHSPLAAKVPDTTSTSLLFGLSFALLVGLRSKLHKPRNSTSSSPQPKW